MEIENAETARLQVHVDQRDQHEHRTEEGVEEELDGGVDAVRSAPDTDNQEHRYQHRFPEDVEQHRIQCGEHAVHQAFHDQEGGHVLRRLVLDHLPAGQHHQYRGKRGEDNQRHGNAIDTEVIVGAEGSDPGHILLELHHRRGIVKMRVQQGAQQEGHNGHHQCRLATGRVAQGIHHQQGHTTENRQPHHGTQNGKVDHCTAPGEIKTNQDRMNNSPIIMLKA